MSSSYKKANEANTEIIKNNSEEGSFKHCVIVDRLRKSAREYDDDEKKKTIKAYRCK